MNTTSTKSRELKEVFLRLDSILEPVESIWGYTIQGLLGGKMIRPNLLILSASFGNAPEEIVYDAAAAIEMIHLASLIHDDVVDKAETRRGLPTVSCAVGNHSAVLMGDYLFAQAFNLLAKYEREYNLITPTTLAIAEMSLGELYQQKQAFDLNVTEEKYFSRIQKKTASLFEAACYLGALIGNLKQKEIECLRKFGTLLGLAFQLMDDISDFSTTKKQAGKPVENDLNSGVITLPVILLLQNPYYMPKIRNNLKNPTEENINEICQIVRNSGVLDSACARAHSILKQAIKQLAPLPDKSKKHSLIALANNIFALSNTKNKLF